MKNLCVIILTYNEEKHIERCLKSVENIASKIIIIDSNSTDNTLFLAGKYNTTVYRNKWVNYATQFNFGVEIVASNNNVDYVMRLDADEYLTDELAIEIQTELNGKNPRDGYFINRRVSFLGQWIKFGDCYPITLLRLWKNGLGVCENRWMDEHIKLDSGDTTILKNDFYDDNLNNLTWWFEKHNNYATREAVDLLNYQFNFRNENDVEPSLFDGQAQRKRWFKAKYANFPLFIRPFIYFLYRYIIKFGFLDGKKGLIWHFLQGFCYRFLVDAKIYDIKRISKERGISIGEVLYNVYNIDIKNT
jgi:glycosyltransferase involved in cell wall biosynthesis